ncbi:ABC transporter permease [Prevotella sp. 10(H)]|uniref:ABC transporter permease n=1 Tax=Prevotella sp. 10(H) TaxID=1158294 RepID=UPI0004A71C64|nr:FtsX-like permease family protein [Prevotella sp. 10(H)]
MIQHIFKIIWVERKVNAWILLELILVFCVLWFCIDYIYYTTKRYIQPKGFDIEHTYQIIIGLKPESRNIGYSGDSTEIARIKDHTWTIYDRISQYPAIEHVSYSSGAYPYTNTMSTSTFMIDSVTVEIREKSVMPEFFDVFKINIIKGSNFTDANIMTEDPVILSSGKDNLFGKKPAEEMDYLRTGSDTNKIVGVANKTKINEYEEYKCIRYKPMKRNGIAASYNELCVRVKPEADKDFISKFSKDMRSQLELGPYYLRSVSSIEKERHEFMKFAGYSSNFKSIYSVSAFLIINIFLGVIGTFWFRVQSRRSEIGLRMALGASKSSVKKMFIGETILLLLIASIIATFICLNITAADLLKNINVPIVNRENEDVNIVQYCINYGITFLFLAIIAIGAVWYPAKRASDIQPTETLRDE